MENFEFIKSVYAKSISKALTDNDILENFTDRQQEIILELKSSIENLQGGHQQKIEHWIDNTALRFTRSTWQVLSDITAHNLKSLYDGRFQDIDGRYYYEVLIPDESGNFELIGYTDDSNFYNKL